MNPCPLVFLASLSLGWPAAPPPTAPSRSTGHTHMSKTETLGGGHVLVEEIQAETYQVYWPSTKRLLVVAFKGQMEEAQPNQLTFFGDVRVLSTPWDTPDRPFSFDQTGSGQLPAGAVYFMCTRLDLHKGQEDTVPLEAAGPIVLRTCEISAYAKRLRWREDRRQAMLAGRVTASRFWSDPPEEIAGERFTLDLETGHIFIERPAFR